MGLHYAVEWVDGGRAMDVSLTHHARHVLADYHGAAVACGLSALAVHAVQQCAEALADAASGSVSSGSTGSRQRRPSEEAL